MLVSVAIPAYNAAEYLREAIASVIAQTYPHVEIVVVDDGSTDHTREVCASFGERVRYFYKENDGTAGFGARYLSIAESRGEWIALLDQDDRWLPTKLEKQIEAARRFPEASVVFTRYQVIGGAGEPLPALNITDAPGGLFRLDAHEALHTLLRSNPFTPSSALLSRRALADTPAHDASGAGDWDMWFNFASRGHSFAVVDEYLTEYRVFDEQFCSNKESLARRMRRTLARNATLVRPGCEECRDALRAGRAHIRDIFAVAARTHLDEFHAATRRGGVREAMPKLWRAINCSPAEVFRPRRLLAVSKSYAVGASRLVR